MVMQCQKLAKNLAGKSNQVLTKVFTIRNVSTDSTKINRPAGRGTYVLTKFLTADRSCTCNKIFLKKLL